LGELFAEPQTFGWFEHVELSAPLEFLPSSEPPASMEPFQQNGSMEGSGSTLTWAEFQYVPAQSSTETAVQQSAKNRGEIHQDKRKRLTHRTTHSL
jgi:hypothetical protein